MSETIPSSLFVKPKWDAVILLSSLEFLNMASVWIYFSLSYSTGNKKLDVLIVLITLILFNGIYFVKNDRFKRFSKLYEDNPRAKNSAKLITITYCLGSIIIFSLVHSSN
jgi:hypothetical protein